MNLEKVRKNLEELENNLEELLQDIDKIEQEEAREEAQGFISRNIPEIKSAYIYENHRPRIKEIFINDERVSPLLFLTIMSSLREYLEAEIENTLQEQEVLCKGLKISNEEEEKQKESPPVDFSIGERITHQ